MKKKNTVYSTRGSICPITPDTRVCMIIVEQLFSLIKHERRVGIMIIIPNCDGSSLIALIIVCEAPIFPG